jgi:hypothetical protein
MKPEEAKAAIAYDSSNQGTANPGTSVTVSLTITGSDIVLINNELFPNADYRYIWEHVDRVMSDKDACKFIVGLIHLAATEHCEEELARTVICLIKQEKKLSLYDLQYQFKQAKNVVPIVRTQQHPLAAYNDLIPNNMQGSRHG